MLIGDNMNYNFKMLENEYWWGGSSLDGGRMPLNSESSLSHDFSISAPNQTMPMFLSSCGRCIWSPNPFKVRVEKGVFQIEGEDVSLESFGNSLREAYLGASEKYFPAKGELLEEEFFKVPQYNTWMQMTYNQTQDGVMQYAKGIIQNGFKPGILMIDEGWQKDYGVWEFNKAKFPNPEEMLKDLHKMGFKVMLWVVPYVTPNGLFFIKHTDARLSNTEIEEYFVRTKDGKVALFEWWNGVSAAFDLTKECDRNLLDGQLKALMAIGVDGFKFDGGHIDSYTENCQLRKGELPSGLTPQKLNEAWNDFGTKYKFHEFKDTFKGGGKRVIQRMCDRSHRWQGDGIDTILPNALLQGLLGHPFICPDMIGGGEWSYKELGLPVDGELFVRMAQLSALFPMLQFSWAPWEAVDEYHLALIKNAHNLHLDFADEIISLVNDAYKNGEPIIRNLEYNYPHCGYENIKDIFMLGDKYLVAPVIKKGELKKQIPLPEGKWKGFDGEIYEGGKTLDLNVTIEALPYFEKIG